MEKSSRIIESNPKPSITKPTTNPQVPHLHIVLTLPGTVIPPACKAAYPWKLTFQAGNPSLIQGAKPTALGVGFPLLPPALQPFSAAALKASSQNCRAVHGVSGLCVLRLVVRMPGEVLVWGCTHLSTGGFAASPGCQSGWDSEQKGNDPCSPGIPSPVGFNEPAGQPLLQNSSLTVGFKEALFAPLDLSPKSRLE